MNLGNNINYDELLKLASMRTLQHRRLEQSLILFFKSFKQGGPVYLSDFFKPRIYCYNLRHNVQQDINNSHYLHGSYSYILAHIWNKLPLAAKSASTLIFKSQLKHCELRGCQCQSCIQPFIFSRKYLVFPTVVLYSIFLTSISFLYL